MKLISWNCHGMGNASAVRGFWISRSGRILISCSWQKLKWIPGRLKTFGGCWGSPTWCVNHVWEKVVVLLCFGESVYMLICKQCLNTLLMQQSQLMRGVGGSQVSMVNQIQRRKRLLGELCVSSIIELDHGCAWVTSMRFFFSMRNKEGQLDLNSVWICFEKHMRIVTWRI
jgi:hypothetical protein